MDSRVLHCHPNRHIFFTSTVLDVILIHLFSFFWLQGVNLKKAVTLAFLLSRKYQKVGFGILNATFLATNIGQHIANLRVFIVHLDIFKAKFVKFNMKILIIFWCYIVKILENAINIFAFWSTNFGIKALWNWPQDENKSKNSQNPCFFLDFWNLCNEILHTFKPRLYYFVIT